MEFNITKTPEVVRASRVENAVELANMLCVTTHEEAQCAADYRTHWAKKIDSIEALKKAILAPVKKALEETKTNVSHWFDDAINDYDKARSITVLKIQDWQKAERERVEAIRREEDRKAREIIEEAKKEAAELKAYADEQAKLCKDAAEAEAILRASEETQKLIEIEAQAQAYASAIEAVVPKIDGQSTVRKWVAALKPGFDERSAKLAICKAIAAGQENLLELISVDTAARGPLHGLAKALKGSMNVPGYVAVEQESISGSRK